VVKNARSAGLDVPKGHHDVVSMWRSAPRRRQAVYVAPSADVGSTDVGYVIRAEMPGVEKDGLEISVDRGELLIYQKPKPSNLARSLCNKCTKKTTIGGSPRSPWRRNRQDLLAAEQCTTFMTNRDSDGSDALR
jgi:hypothetical protein